MEITVVLFFLYVLDFIDMRGVILLYILHRCLV